MEQDRIEKVRIPEIEFSKEHIVDKLIALSEIAHNAEVEMNALSLLLETAHGTTIERELDLRKIKNEDV